MIETAPQDRVLAILSREISVDSLPHLTSALRPEYSLEAEFADWAIGFDSNVLLNLAKGRRGADLVDYLAKIHRGPLILPLQAVQEFWNNRIYAVSGLADNIRKEFSELEKLVKQIDPTFRDFQVQLEPLLDDFRSKYGHVLDERTASELDALLSTLQDVSIRSEMCRSSLYPIARQRKLAKTPPGFKDEGDGDFLVWADYLLGLSTAQNEERGFSVAALVTDDTKKDWSTKGTTNPILAAEVFAISGAKFRTLTLEAFSSLATGSLSSQREIPESQKDAATG